MFMAVGKYCQKVLVRYGDKEEMAKSIPIINDIFRYLISLLLIIYLIIVKIPKIIHYFYYLQKIVMENRKKENHYAFFTIFCITLQPENLSHHAKVIYLQYVGGELLCSLRRRDKRMCHH